MGVVPSVRVCVLTKERGTFAPDRVALAESLTEWPSLLMAAIVVLAGMPAPITSMPVVKACVEKRPLTVALSLTSKAVWTIELSRSQVVFLFCVPFFTKIVVPPGSLAAVSASVALLHPPADAR